MKNIVSTFVALCLIAFSQCVFADVITGVVTADGNDNPIVGANIMVKGTTNVTLTDIDGNFKIDANVGEKLVISYKGYRTQEVAATSKLMNIALIPENAVVSQDYVVRCVAFYNLENLFDTIHDYYILNTGDTVHKNDYEYLPDGGMHWSGLKYRNKLKNMAYAISQFGLDKTALGASIIGVCEVENIGCLQDLCKEIENQTGRKYIPILLEGPDRRGVDVGYLYDPRYFVPSGKPVPYTLQAHYSDGGKVRSRFQLLLSGYLKDENGSLVRDKLHLIVNHWPSRYGGEESSRATRDTAAMLCRHICDSLYMRDSNAKVIIMGDLNDDPFNHSCAHILEARKTREEVKKQGFFNTMWLHLDRGVGTLMYNGTWDLFDQIIISEPLLNAPHERTQWTYWKSEVFNKPFLTVQEGKDKGAPLRTHKSGVWQNGYGDHYPTMIYLIKNK